MSGAMAWLAAGTSRGSGQAAERGNPHPWVTPVNAVIAIGTLLALSLRAYQVFRPGLFAITQYDDGPYFGSAVRLVHGVWPYRDFGFVQPPGITVLMTPVALLAKVEGTAWGMAAGRILTLLAGSASVLFAGLLVRHRGPLAALLTCGILAIHPDSVTAAHTILLEPWLVLLCLAGALAVFDADRLAGNWRLAWGGTAFGLAGAVKAWAIVPVLVILALGLPHVRRAGVFAGGVAAGFLLPVLPFAAPDPRLFFDSVVGAQLGRISARASVWRRLGNMVGFRQVRPADHGSIVVGCVIVLAVILGATAARFLITRRRPPALDLFALVTTALIVPVLLWPSYYASHYAAFLAPFLALAIALPVSGLVQARGLLILRPRLRRALRWLLAGLVCAAVAVAGLQTIAVATPRPHGNPSAVIRRVIPAGACVLTDKVSYLLVANRFTSAAPGCSQIVDGLGTDLVLSGGRSPETGAGRSPAVQAAWRQAFDHAQYLLLSSHNILRIAWTAKLSAYFRDNFRQVLYRHDYRVYVRKPLAK